MLGRAELDGLPETGHRLDGVADDPPVAGGEEAGQPIGDRVVPREGPIGVEGLPHQVPVLPQVEAARVQHDPLDAGLGEAAVLEDLEALAGSENEHLLTDLEIYKIIFALVDCLCGNGQPFKLFYLLLQSSERLHQCLMSFAHVRHLEFREIYLQFYSNFHFKHCVLKRL